MRFVILLDLLDFGFLARSRLVMLGGLVAHVPGKMFVGDSSDGVANVAAADLSQRPEQAPGSYG